MSKVLDDNQIRELRARLREVVRDVWVLRNREACEFDKSFENRILDGVIAAIFDIVREEYLNWNAGDWEDDYEEQEA